MDGKRDSSTERQQLEQAIAHLEAQRPILGDAVVDAALAPLHEKLVALRHAETSALELQGERKRVTVMFADISGFTSMFENMDPEAVRDLVNALFEQLLPRVMKYRGTIDKFIGDEVMALFGAPMAHENDPERALRAALEMMDTLDSFNAQRGTNLGLHLGIATGLVIAGGIGTQGQQAYSVMGDAVNLAARLKDVSRRGEILVGPDTYRLTEPLFSFEAKTPVRVKGKAGPISVYQLRGLKAVPGKLRGIEGMESALVGRESELAALREAIERLSHGEGGVITIEGEAGLGKSRLVAETRTYMMKTDSAPYPFWVEGRCLSYGSSIAYLLWLDVLRGLLDMATEDPPSVVRDALQEKVQTLCPNRFDDVFPYLARLMSLPLSTDDKAMLRALEGESLKNFTFRAVEALIESAARKRPLILVCEDLHWADPTSIELLEQMLGLTDRAALLLICVMRPEAARPGMLHGSWRIKEIADRLYLPHHTAIQLSPLSPAESEVLIDNLLLSTPAWEGGMGRSAAGVLPRELRRRILGHAEGNPFYVEEILRSLMESGIVVRQEATGLWQAMRNLADITIPDTLHGVLMARIDRLEEETKRVLQLAAVIGRVFFYRVLAEIAQDQEALDAHLLILQQGQMIRERAQEPELEYIFKHHLTQEAAYSGLLKKERRIFHRQVAEALERLFPDRIDEQVGLLAYHWERAEEPEKAIEYLLRAGDQARLAYANEEAIAHFHRALDLLAEVGEKGKEWRLEALHGLGQICFGMGKVAEAEIFLREAIALGQKIDAPPRELVELYYWLGEVMHWEGRYDEQSQIGEEGLELLREDQDSESVEAALMNQEAAIGYAYQGQTQKFRAYTSRTARFIRRLPYVEELRPAYVHIFEMYAYYEKDVEQAMEWLHALESKATVHYDLRALGDAHRIAGGILHHRGDLHGSLPRYQQALELYIRIGDNKHESLCLIGMGESFLSLGNLNKAEEYIDKALETVKAVGIKRDFAWIHENMGRISICQGDWERAGDAFRKAVELRSEIHSRQAKARSICALGQAHLARGDRREANERFEQVIALMGSEKMNRDPSLFAEALSGLEEASPMGEAFHTLCRRLQETYPAIESSPFVQWALEPAQVTPNRRLRVRDHFLEALSADWVWQDPFGDCYFAVQKGLEVYAANGRGLRQINQSAPRLLRQTSGNLAFQTVCGPVSDEKPAIGGLLLWEDDRNYLRLDVGEFGKHEISFSGCMDNEDVIIGRGKLAFEETIFLQLERLDDQVTALCSTDGVTWLTIGQTTFTAQDPIQIGLHAIGNVNRTIYHGAYPDGTAIRFNSFQLWGMQAKPTLTSPSSSAQKADEP